MNMPFQPYSKEQQLKGHQKKKDTPKFKEKRPKKRKKAQRIKGRVIPTAKVRSSISKKEYNRAIEAFGESCIYCGSSHIEMHHIRFRSQQGRGGFRNLVPLCKRHHLQVHNEREIADTLREVREKYFGPWYWADKFDLFKEGLIPNTDDKSFEKFMERERERIEQENTR
jgi:5-methylcytosine-specific restriction endonuclease McrA